MLATFFGFWWCLEWVQGKCCRITWYLWVKKHGCLEQNHIIDWSYQSYLQNPQTIKSCSTPCFMVETVVGYCWLVTIPPIQLFVESQVVIRPLSRLRLPPLRCDVRLFLASRNSAISRKQCAIDN